MAWYDLRMRNPTILAIFLVASCTNTAQTTQVAADDTPLPYIPRQVPTAALPLVVRVGDAARGDKFQLSVMAPANAAETWVCMQTGNTPCTKQTPGVLPTVKGGRSPRLQQFMLMSGLPPDKDVRLVAVAVDARGQPLGSVNTLVGRKNAQKPQITPPPQQQKPQVLPPAPPPKEPGAGGLPPPGNIPALPAVPGVNVAYDFRGTAGRPGNTAAAIRLVVQNGPLKGKANLRVTGTLRNPSIRLEPLPILTQEAVRFFIYRAAGVGPGGF
jgi:hypothetical protein